MVGQWSYHRIVKEVGIVGSMLYRNHYGNILNTKEVKATKHLKQRQNGFSLLQKNNREILLNVFTMFEVQTLAWNFSFFDNVFMMFTTQTLGIACCDWWAGLSRYITSPDATRLPGQDLQSPNTCS